MLKRIVNWWPFAMVADMFRIIFGRSGGVPQPPRPDAPPGPPCSPKGFGSGFRARMVLRKARKQRERHHRRHVRGRGGMA